MIEKKRSAVTYIRRALKVRGKSEHNGRGAVRMDFDCTSDELRDRLKAFADTDSNVVEVFEKDDLLVVRLNNEFNEYYRTVSFRKGYNIVTKKHYYVLNVLFAFPDKTLEETYNV